MARRLIDPWVIVAALIVLVGSSTADAGLFFGRANRCCCSACGYSRCGCSTCGRSTCGCSTCGFSACGCSSCGMPASSCSSCGGTTAPMQPMPAPTSAPALTPPAPAPSAPAPSAPVPGGKSAAAGPVTRATYMPVSGPTVIETAAPVYCQPTQMYNTAGASNMPRSSWDFGRWPGN